MDKTKLGATGNFPEGKINDVDEGEVRMAIFAEDKNLIIHFGTPVLWLGLPKQKAIDLAENILKKVKEID